MILLSAALAAAAAVAARAQAPSSWDARLTDVSGEVSIYAPDGAGKPAAAAKDLPLSEGDRIVVSPGASAEVSLDGGSLIALGEGSDFTLTKLARAQAEFSLAVGSLLAKIKHLGGDRLQVRTRAAVAAVRGTEFAVEAEGEARSRVGVFDEGRVEVSGGGGMETLTANQETSIENGQAPAKPGALNRLERRRQGMRALLKRLEKVQRGWKALPSERRQDLRRDALARGIERLERRLERRALLERRNSKRR